MSSNNEEREISEEHVKQEELQTERAEAVARKSWAWTWVVRGLGVLIGLAILFFASVLFVLWWYGVPTLLEVKHAQVAAWKASEGALPDMISHADSAARHIDSVTSKVDDNTAAILEAYAGAPTALETALAAIANQSNLTGQQLRGNLQSFQKITDNAEPGITESTRNLESATGTIARAASSIERAAENPKIEQFVDDALDQGKSILAELNATSGDVRFIADQGKSIVVKADGTMTEIEATSGNLETSTEHVANILGYADDKLKPKPPAHGFWGHIKRGLLYFVTFIKDTAGTGYLLFKITGGS